MSCCGSCSKGKSCDSSKPSRLGYVWLSDRGVYAPPQSSVGGDPLVVENYNPPPPLLTPMSSISPDGGSSPTTRSGPVYAATSFGSSGYGSSSGSAQRSSGRSFWDMFSSGSRDPGRAFVESYAVASRGRGNSSDYTRFRLDLSPAPRLNMKMPEITRYEGMTLPRLDSRAFEIPDVSIGGGGMGLDFGSGSGGSKTLVIGAAIVAAVGFLIWRKKQKQREAA